MPEVYFGTKEVIATPMNRLDYNKYRGWELPSDEDGSDDGFLVEYLDGGASNHPDHVGYISWSPAGVFKRSYQASGGLSFGHALVAMEQGRKVARKGWNGKGMWVALMPGSCFPPEFAKPGHAAKHRADELPEQTAGLTINLMPHIDMRAADGSMVVGWLASQTDMLAKDWHIVENR